MDSVNRRRRTLQQAERGGTLSLLCFLQHKLTFSGSLEVSGFTTLNSCQVELYRLPYHAELYPRDPRISSVEICKGRKGGRLFSIGCLPQHLGNFMIYDESAGDPIQQWQNGELEENVFSLLLIHR